MPLDRSQLHRRPGRRPPVHGAGAIGWCHGPACTAPFPLAPLVPPPPPQPPPLSLSCSLDCPEPILLFTFCLIVCSSSSSTPLLSLSPLSPVSSAILGIETRTASQTQAHKEITARHISSNPSIRGNPPPLGATPSLFLRFLPPFLVRRRSLPDGPPALAIQFLAIAFGTAHRLDPKLCSACGPATAFQSGVHQVSLPRRRPLPHGRHDRTAQTRHPRPCTRSIVAACLL